MVFVLVFLGALVFSFFYERSHPGRPLRSIPAFDRFRREIGLAVEAGKRLHITLGRGSLSGQEAGSALIGLHLLEHVSRTAAISDRPPVTTSGDGSLSILSQDAARAVLRSSGGENQYDPTTGRLSGLTPYAYAAGTIPVILDEQVAATIVAGHFGSEVALITDAAARNGTLTLAGSDNLSAQAVIYATAEEPLIGEELFAAGAYLNAGPAHRASLRAQDIIRWLLVGIILAGAGLKLIGFL
jgi:hypothetical protein